MLSLPNKTYLLILYSYRPHKCLVHVLEQKFKFKFVKYKYVNLSSNLQQEFKLKYEVCTISNEKMSGLAINIL